MGNERRYARATAAVIEHLYDRRGVETASEVPNPLPPEFIQVDRTGGRRLNQVVERVQLTVLVWAETKVRAEELALDARADFDALRTVDGIDVYRLEEVGGPASSPDPDRNSPRYQFTVALHLRVTTI